MSVSPNPDKSNKIDLSTQTDSGSGSGSGSGGSSSVLVSGTDVAVEAAVPAKLLLGSPPHVHTTQSVPAIMGWVVIAMMPAVLASFWLFGLEAVRVMALSVGSCIGIEYLCFRFMKTPGSLGDLSALVTGMLLGMNLPPTAPWWMVIAGSVVAILVAKQLFGGIGANIFNPALTARVFLLVAWPGHMTTWLNPVRSLGPTHGLATDLAGVTGATPLAALREGAGAQQLASLGDLFWGNVGGSLGEVSAIALIIGGLILVWRRIITPDIPLAYIGTVFVITLIARLVGGEGYASPVWHVLSGGLLLGAIFMATDLVTSPITIKGKIVFGIGCGILTAVIRLWSSGYPEGVSFSILLMNALTPLIDSYFKPATFGSRRLVKPGVAK